MLMSSHDKEDYLHYMHSFRIALKPHKTAKKQDLIKQNCKVF